MKKLIYLIFTASLTSCSSTVPYYQVYKTSVPKEFKTIDKELVFEDDNCKIFYDLWSIGGNMNFQIYNKTEEALYLHLDNSFYILNGLAYDYYQDRTISTSVGKSSAVSRNAFSTRYNTVYDAGASQSSSSTISRKEKNLIVIPAQTAKIITENYSVTSSRFKHCDLTVYPSRKQGKSAILFEKKSSPFVFSNRLSYSLSKTNEKIIVEHQFFVKEIINYTKDEMFITKKDTICGKESSVLHQYFKDVSNKDFYIKYVKTLN